jgi:hypothetical protein
MTVVERMREWSMAWESFAVRSTTSIEMHATLTTGSTIAMGAGVGTFETRFRRD